MLKRIADWLEKVSVAGIALGLFQDQPLFGLLVAFITLGISLAITTKIGG
jgi:hypothetical protein